MGHAWLWDMREEEDWAGSSRAIGVTHCGVRHFGPSMFNAMIVMAREHRGNVLMQKLFIIMNGANIPRTN